MALWLDPTETVPYEVEGTTFAIRICSARELSRLLETVLPIFSEVRDELRAAGIDEEDLDEGNFEIPGRFFSRFFEPTRIAIAGFEGRGVPQAAADAALIETVDGVRMISAALVDRISPKFWPGIVGKCLAANRLGRDDAGE
jgi:hypothetical protein